MHHRKMPAGRASLHRRQHHAIDRLMPFTGAPLFHALQLLATSDSARFHMPGHKGQPVFNSFRDVFAIDYTETYGTGNLYLGDGPIRDAEVAAARYFGANDCFFLTGGSTQGILAMLGAAVGRGGSVLIDREVHRSVCHGCALLDITPYFFSAPLLEPFGITGALRVEDAERQLLAHPDIRAVLLTSPTYYGLRRDLPAFADLCRAHGKLLLVDAAHGAHFPAVGLPSPVEEGADMAVLSMHKTMPCLGQAAVLLSGPGTDRASLRENTALFGTSSPSYPIMASIDLARAYNEGPGREKYQKAAAVCREMREYICAHTVFTALTERDFPSLDPCRLHRRHRHHRTRSRRCAVERARRRLRDGRRAQRRVHPHRKRHRRRDPPSETRSARTVAPPQGDRSADRNATVPPCRARHERARRPVRTLRRGVALGRRGPRLRPSRDALSARRAAALARRENYKGAR